MVKIPAGMQMCYRDPMTGALFVPSEPIWLIHGFCIVSNLNSEFASTDMWE
jgi:hypothetical protein